MKTFSLLLSWILWMLLVLPHDGGALTTDQQEDICASAAVIMCENFENRALGPIGTTLTTSKFKNSGWASSFTGPGMAVVNTQAFDGSKAVEWFYPSGDDGSGYFDTGFPARRDYYIRFYMKNSSNWVWSSNGNKMVYVGGDVHPDNLMFDQGVFGGATPAFIGQNGASNTTFRYPNVGGGYSWVNNEWVCVEFHPTMNSTASSSDGAFEGWINDQQKFSHTGLNLDTAETTFSRIKFSAYWNCCGPHPVMYRWVDNIVVSTQRIGCGSGAPPDTSLPNAPTNLTVTELWDGIKQLVATVWSWIGPSSAEAAVPNDKLTLYWTSQEAGIDYELRWQSFAHPEWINLGLVPSKNLQLVVPISPPVSCQAGQDCYVCADARAKRLSDGVFSQWVSETPNGKACNQFAVGPIVIPPPPPPPDPVPTVDIFKNILETELKLSFQYLPADCPKGITKATSTTSKTTGLRTVTLTCAK